MPNESWMESLKKRLQLFSVRIPYASLYSYSRTLSYSLISRRGRNGEWHVYVSMKISLTILCRKKIVTRGRDVVLPLDGIEPSLARKSASAN